MRPRIFLRTAEFLWQEGHTAHETQQEAEQETATMHKVYEDFQRDVLAVPSIPGEKTEHERFPGAVRTYTVEAMVQDRKAIQAGTSHFLGQNFAKAQNISFAGRNNERQYAWTTSWGVSTRMIGTLIMAHSDDDGLVCPPRVAPKQIVIIPITPKAETRQSIIDHCEELAARLSSQNFHGLPLRVMVDTRDVNGGIKKWEWIKKGVPLRVEIGPRDLEKGTVCLCRRDKAANEKEFVSEADFEAHAKALLDDVQQTLLQRQLAFRDSHIRPCNSLAELKENFAGEGDADWLLCPWDGSAQEEEELGKSLRISIRCIPQGEMGRGEEAPCILTGRPTTRRVIWARSY